LNVPLKSTDGRQKTIFGYGGFFALSGENKTLCLRIMFLAERLGSVFLGFVPKRYYKNLSTYSFI
jgi:hypothetical protein